MIWTFLQSNETFVSICVFCAVCVWVSVCLCLCIPPSAEKKNTSHQMTLREIGIFQQMVSALKGPIAEVRERRK